MSPAAADLRAKLPRMHLRRALACLLLAACPSGQDSTDTSTATSEPGTGTLATTSAAPTTGGTGPAPAPCVAAGIGPAFAWATAPGPGVAQCTRISDGPLALDCSGDFTGIFTLTLSNSEAPGIVTGDPLTVDYRVTKAGDTVTGEWLQIRDQVHWYVVAGQGPTLTPPDAPADWFHPNVEVALVAGDCAAVACDDGSGDQNTPRAISFGQGDQVAVLAPGKDGGVPGEFGGERYHAAVSEAHTGLCGAGEAGAGVDLLAFSVVSSGFQ